MDSKTTIGISKKIRDELASLGNKDTTFEEIILKLINKWSDGK